VVGGLGGWVREERARRTAPPPPVWVERRLVGEKGGREGSGWGLHTHTHVCMYVYVYTTHIYISIYVRTYLLDVGELEGARTAEEELGDGREAEAVLEEDTHLCVCDCVCMGWYGMRGYG
jgi:hypothetical protein